MLLWNLQINPYRANYVSEPNEIKMKKTYSGKLLDDTKSESNDRWSISESDKSSISKIIYSNILLKYACVDF